MNQNNNIDVDEKVDTSSGTTRNNKCLTCNRCLQELIRQGCYLLSGNSQYSPIFNNKVSNNLNEGRLLEKLCLPDHPQIGTDGFCRICETRVIELKIEAARAIRCMKQQNQLHMSQWQTLMNRQQQCRPIHCVGNNAAFINSCRPKHFDRPIPGNLYKPHPDPTFNYQLSPHFYSTAKSRFHPVDYSKPFIWAVKHNLVTREQVKVLSNNQPSMKSNSNVISPQKIDISQDSPKSTREDSKEEPTQYSATLTAAASFFARAGRTTTSTNVETSVSIKRKKKTEHSSTKSDFISNFSEILKSNPPPVPPTLIKSPLNRPFGHSAGKIKVIVRLKYVECSKQDNFQSGSPTQSFITVDDLKKQITVIEPQSATSTPRRMNACIPKIFAFDAVYTDENDQIELCSNALTDIIQSVVSGIDGCIFSFGNLRGVSSFTMIGSDQQIRKLGLIPCAISWLFRLISEQKERTGARFSVRVSAIEVLGKQETLKDLLSDVDVLDTIGQCSPGVYLRDDPVSGTQLQNQSELRAPSAEKAAFYLDSALAARTIIGNEEDARLSHFLFTLHVYQYRVERGTSGSAVAGGRSRLHMLDFSSGRTNFQLNDSYNKEPSTNQAENSKQETKTISTALSLSAIAAVLLALVNGQRHIPYRSSKLSQLLREAMGSLSCRTCMIAQVATNNILFGDNMQIIQFASKMQRLKRRKLSRFSGTSSDDSSSCDSFGLRRASRFRPGNSGVSSESSNNGMTSSEADYTSSSDQSCDTVIYLGASRNREAGDQSTFMLRKRRISAPNFPNSINKKSGSESDLTKIDISQHHSIITKSSVRTNALAWPKVAAKNAIETLSTQKEMWVDGPKAVFEKESSDKCDDMKNHNMLVDIETQTYLIEGSQNMKENQFNLTDLEEFSHDIPDEFATHKNEINSNSRDVSDINTPSKHSKASTTNENPSSVESTIAVVGSSDSDQKLKIATLIDPTSFIPQLLSCHKAQIPSNSLPATQDEEYAPSDFLVSGSIELKPFVWDWVEKHSEMLVCSPLTKDSGSHPFHSSSKEDSQSPQKKVVKHCSKHQQLLAMKKIRQLVNTEVIAPIIEREGRKRHKSAKSKAAHLPPGYAEDIDVLHSHPTTEPIFTRVAEWVRSVSEETSRTQSLSPVRSKNREREHNISSKFTTMLHSTIPSTSNINYRSLDRRNQNCVITTSPNKFSKYYHEFFGSSSQANQYSYVPLGSKMFESSPLSMLQSHQKDNITAKFLQEFRQSPSKGNYGTENRNFSNQFKRAYSQNDEKTGNVTTHLKSQKQNKNFPTRQILDRSPVSKGRSSSLIKNAFFGRCRLSSNNTTDETNPYSLPNSPFRNKTSTNNSAKYTESDSLANTGGYHYVVMTSSASSSTKHIVKENTNMCKKRSSSSSPVKSLSSIIDKKQIASQTPSKKEKNKDNNAKENNKTKVKKESKGRLRFLTSPLFGKKKDKDKSITPIPKVAKSKKSCLQHQQDSSNRGSPSKVISPYSMITQPKHSAHSSSGHGSDCSSIFGHHHKYGDHSGQIKCRECTNIDEENPCLSHVDKHTIAQNDVLRRSQRRGGGHTSSGYESIMRDSEFSSQNDSTSECSLGVTPRPQTPEKQQSQSSSSSSKQSRSAPNRSEETSEDTQSPVSVRKMSPKTTQKFQIKNQQQRENEIRKIAKQIQFEKIYDLLAQQNLLKTELMQSKERILVDTLTWSYDLHVVEQMDPEDSSFIEALEKETDILRRRVDACKSHVLLITYFDSKCRSKVLTDSNSPCSASQRISVPVGPKAEPSVTVDKISVGIQKNH